MKKLVVSAAVALSLGLFFTWGYFAHRNRVFPYNQFRSVGVTLGLFEPIQKKLERPSADLAALRALPYVGGTYDPNKEARGVVLHDSAHAFPGYNLYTSEGSSEAFLVDMDGKVVHRWHHPMDGWHYSELLPEGDLLVVVKDKALLRLDKDSKLKWTYEARAHHAVHLAADGDIYVLTREVVGLPSVHARIPTLVDFVTVLSQDGLLKEKFSLHEIVETSEYAFLMPAVKHLPLEEMTRHDFLDVLHTNQVFVFDGAQLETSPLFAEGNLLVSFKHLSAIAILASGTHEILWLWGPMNVVFQHHPTLLDTGNILLFNNGMEESTVVELNPVTGQIEWQYGPVEDFFSAARGSSQRLGNGNTFITESDSGYAFEVTPEGQVVWRFANPDVSEEGFRRPIYRMKRYAEADPPTFGWLRGRKR